MQSLFSRLVLAATSMIVLTACATRLPIPEPAISGPFVIEEVLLGKTVGQGSITTITGVDRSFTARLDGSWDGQTLTLVEDFIYDDGEIDQKTWRLKKLPNGEYEGTREDVVGTARGFQVENGFRLEYLIDLPTGPGKTTRVGFKDILVLNEAGDVLNEARVGYRGFRVGRVSLVIDRP